MAESVRVLHPSRGGRGKGSVADHRSPQNPQCWSAVCQLDSEPGRVAHLMAAGVGRLQRGTTARARTTCDGGAWPRWKQVEAAQSADRARELASPRGTRTP